MYSYISTMAKAIMISNEVYAELKELKTENKSFSKVLKGLLNKEKRKTVAGISSCFGSLKKDEGWEEIEKDLGKRWKNWSKKYA